MQDLQLPYAQAAAAEAVCRARQEWTSARGVLQQLGEQAAAPTQTAVRYPLYSMQIRVPEDLQPSTKSLTPHACVCVCVRLHRCRQEVVQLACVAVGIRNSPVTDHVSPNRPRLWLPDTTG